MDPSSIDLTPVLMPLIQMLGLAVATLVTALVSWILTELAKKIGIQKNAAAMASIDDAANKSIQAAVMASLDTIKHMGWDHVQTHNQLVAIAAGYMSNFPKTLEQAGIDPTTVDGRAAIQNIVKRALPAAVTQAAASPTTPPVPDEQKAATVVTVATVPSDKPA